MKATAVVLSISSACLLLLLLLLTHQLFIYRHGLSDFVPLSFERRHSRIFPLLCFFFVTSTSYLLLSNTRYLECSLTRIFFLIFRFENDFVGKFCEFEDFYSLSYSTNDELRTRKNKKKMVCTML